MSQHDFDFTTADGNTGPTVRAGMNAMAQALASCSSGAAEPSTMYAYQFWADTTSGYMKQRNAANTAWLTRWQLSVGQLAALAGASFTGLVNLAAGADIASAATIDLTAATGNSPRITGTTPTSAITMNTGQWGLVVADGAWPLTYHATTNKLNTGGLDYTCTAGDLVLYHKDLSGVVHGTIFPVNAVPERGTWTVSVYDANTGGNVSPTTVTGNYTKNGNIVSAHFTGLNNISTVGMTAGNNIYITLPFAAAYAAVGNISLDSFTYPTSRVAAMSIVPTGGARAAIQANASGQTATNFTVASITSGTSDISAFSLTYLTA